MSVDIYKTVSGKERRIYVGQVGQRFNFELGPSTAPFNMGAATRKEIRFKDPAGVIISKTATEVNAPNGSSRSFLDEFGNSESLNVQLEYTVDTSTLFSVAGVWSCWVEVDSATYNQIGTATEFTVFAVGAA